MSILNILEYPDPRLRHVARPAQSVGERERRLAEDMLETMYQAPGIGLAATQVDEDIRLFVMDLSEDHSEPMVFFNPELSGHEGTQTYEEACLPVPEHTAEVKRAATGFVRALDIDAQPSGLQAGGRQPVGTRHEVAHLAGRRFMAH